MIEAVLIFNLHGTPRLSKFYRHYPEQKQQQIIKQVYQIVSRRGDAVCNFIEGGDNILGDKSLKIIYRHYATLYIVFCVDSSESELAILDLIQVHYVLNEIIIGGLVIENSIPNILQALDEQKKLEKNEIPVFYHESH
ncbi:unnamed protein product [Larinioides sclopetarius]|uniref:AP complex subunit sigma n=1 Tax=Larinioides sclopetarius TaxID=280406 RepID=A0AAV2B992_9ARAC